MKSKAEIQTLKSVLKWLDNPRGRLVGTRWFFPIAWILLVVVTATFYVLGRSSRFEFTAIAFFLLGLAYWHAYVLASAARSWPVLTQYFDREAIEHRLRELEA
jgi:hypothetical protein